MQKYQAIANKLKQKIVAMLIVMSSTPKRAGIFYYLVAVALVGFAVVVRLAIAPFSDGIPFLTFFPAATLAAVLGGFGPGMFATILGMCMASYIFIPPYNSFSFEFQSVILWSNMVFFVEEFVVCLAIETMHRFRRNNYTVTHDLNVANTQLQQDLKERDRAELRRIKLEKKLTHIAASVPGVIYSFRLRPDGSYCFPYASPAIKDIYGIAAEDLTEDAAPAAMLVHPDDMEYLHDSIAESAHSLNPWKAEWRIMHPEKGEVWLEASSVPERELDGSTLWYGFIHDITDHKQVEVAFKEMDVRKNEFLAMLGHELRNPLAPIRNVVQIMKAQSFTDPTLEWSIHVIDRQVSHIARLLDDLLDVARIMQDKIVLKLERFDFAEIVDSAVEASRPLIDMRAHELLIATPKTPLWVEGDHVRLTQVFTNILNNAAKYTEKGGKITLTVTLEDAWVVTKVRDTGIGMPAEILPLVFDLFTQAERSIDRSQGGMGVGLTLVRRLVDMHKGVVTASSAGIGQGSEFTVRLPLSNAIPVSESPQAESTSSSSKLRILVIDDYSDAAESLALMLQTKGYDAITAECGEQGVERAIDFRPQIVLLDIGLPDIDGYEVAKRLRKLPETQGAILIALTGYGQPEDHERSRASGFDYHLLKPVDTEALSALLALSGHHL
ncbi:MAG: response regulator [Methylobacter sp.]|nr:MAG: response regulator [Methylobacter sp.]